MVEPQFFCIETWQIYGFSFTAKETEVILLPEYQKAVIHDSHFYEISACVLKMTYSKKQRNPKEDLLEA